MRKTETSLPVSLIQLRLGQWAGGFRKQIVVPNVSWGLLNHECDLVVCSKSGYLTEFEIKRSYADFLADFRKRHAHDDDERIKAFYYAVPVAIAEKVMAFLRKRRTETEGFVMPAVLSYDENGCIGHVSGSGCGEDWSAKRKVRPLDDKEMAHLAHLGCMRLFDVTEKLMELQERYTEAAARLSGGRTDMKELKRELKESEGRLAATEREMSDARYESRHNPDLDAGEKAALDNEYDRLEVKRYGEQKYRLALERMLAIFENNTIK